MKIDRLQNDERLRQFVRFGVVGVLSSAVHYAIYYLLLFVLTASISYIIGYLVSFVGNYFFTNCYTFRTKPSWKHFAGFAGSHAVNFGLHVVLFQYFPLVGNASIGDSCFCDGNLCYRSVHHSPMGIHKT